MGLVQKTRDVRRTLTPSSRHLEALWPALVGSWYQTSAARVGSWQFVGQAIPIVVRAIPVWIRSTNPFGVVGIFDVPAQQHGVILVLGVVAMLHIGAREVTYTDRNIDTGGGIDLGPEAIHVLATESLPGWWCHAVAGDDLAFLEVDVGGMRPTAGVVGQMPDFHGVFGGRR